MTHKYQLHFFLTLILACGAVAAVNTSAAAVPAFTTKWFLALFSLMALAVVGLYNCIIFVMRSKDRAPLYFGLYCIFIAINNFVSNSGISFLTELFPHAGPVLLRKIDIVTIILSIPFFIMFLQAFYPIFDSVFFKRSFQYAALVFFAVATVASGKLLEWVFSSYFPVILLSIIYCITICIRAINTKQRDSHGILTGIIVLSAAGINDVLWGYGVLKTVIIMPYATLVFALIYSALISRRFANALTSAERLNAELLENQRLRAEMQHREAAEQDLRQAQRRLTALLHAVDSPLYALNSSGIMVFCNRAFEELSGKTLSELIGKDPPDIQNQAVSPTVIPLELEDEELSVYLIGQSDSDIVPNRSVISFVEEINRNRARVRSLEKIFAGTTPEAINSNRDLRHDIEMIDTALEQMGRMLLDDEDSEKKKQLGMEVLVLAIDYWAECTKTSKFELAEESGLWKVQINPDGWKRTQTLDRYLDYKTFPQNPRWNQIVKTADFVLIRCHKPSGLRNRLELTLQKLCMQTEFSR